METRKCTKCDQIKPIEEFLTHKRYARGRRMQCRECTNKDRRAWRVRNLKRSRANDRTYWEKNKDHIAKQERVRALSNPARKMLSSAKRRAKIIGLPFDLCLSDITIPEKCPVLGIVLKKGKEKLCASSPTLDRIDSKMGYVKDNVMVISWRANNLKSNATLKEMQLLAHFYTQLHEDTLDAAA